MKRVTSPISYEQVVLCFCWVNSGFETHEDFVGLYMADSIDSATIYRIILDTMQRFNLSTTKIRGQCYDGAASMSSLKSGVATRLLQEEPRAIYMHCYRHSLNPACADAIKKCSVMKNALDTTFEITKLIHCLQPDQISHGIRFSRNCCTLPYQVDSEG